MSLHTSQHGHLKNSTTINAGGSVERREPSYPGWECKSVHPLWRTIQRGFQTLSNKVPCDPAIPCLGMDPGKTKFSRYCTLTIMAALDTLAKIQKKPKCRRTGEWLKKPGSGQLSSVQSLSCVRLYATPWIAVYQASLSITNSRSSLRLVSIGPVMPSSHFILCRPLLLWPPVPPSIRVFSSESTLCIRWPKYWSFSFNISPSNEHSGMISFRMDWLDLLAVQGTLKSLL